MLSLVEVSLPGWPRWSTLSCNRHPNLNQRLAVLYGLKLTTLGLPRTADYRRFEPLLEEHLFEFPYCDKIPRKARKRHEPAV